MTYRILRGFKIVCELPPGSSVMALDGRLVACHPNHNPIFIGMGNNTPLTGSPEPRGGTNGKPGIPGHGGFDDNDPRRHEQSSEIDLQLKNNEPWRKPDRLGDMDEPLPEGAELGG